MDLNGRRDGSSRFGPGNQFGNFGSVAAGWIFSSEPLLKTQFPDRAIGNCEPAMASWATIRHQLPIPGHLSNVQCYQGTFGAFRPIANPDFRWEVTRKLETSIELGFPKGRILFSFRGFKTKVPINSSDTLTFPNRFYKLSVQLTGRSQKLWHRMGVVDHQYQVQGFFMDSLVQYFICKQQTRFLSGARIISYANTYVAWSVGKHRKGFHYLGMNSQKDKRYMRPQQEKIQPILLRQQITR